MRDRFRDAAAIGATIVVVAVLLAAAVTLQAARERLFPPIADTEETLYLRSGTTVRRLAGPFAPLAADLYWIRTLQHYGGAKRRLTREPDAAEREAAASPASSSDYALLYPLLDITTTVDPAFRIAYRFGAVFLAESYPTGPGRPDLAVALLEKGLRAQPDKWEYMQDIGFVHYWYTHDYRAAADWFERAADVPGAPWWLRSLAATTLAQGGDRRSSRLMWEVIRQSAEIDWLKQDAERRLAQLDALDAIDAVQQRVNDFVKTAGRPPADWNELVRSGRVPGIPIDPTGVPLELADGVVRLSRRSRLWPPPVEAPPIAVPPA